MENHIHNRLGNLKSFNNFKQLSERFLAKNTKKIFYGLWKCLVIVKIQYFSRIFQERDTFFSQLRESIDLSLITCV